MSVARQRMAMTSEATVMSKRVLRSTPSPPWPMVIWRSARSFRSTTRGQEMSLGLMLSSLPWNRWLSSTAAHRLWAVVMAWMSPVKWRLMSSMGITWA